MTSDELKTRFKKWAVQICLFTRAFPKDEELRIIKGQLVRCATSVAANFRAACRGKSTPDFINKLKIVEEELDESMFWFEFIAALETRFRDAIAPQFKEANELL